MPEPLTYSVYLADEIPKFHSGERVITVLEYGHKWVRLKCGNRTTRMLKSRWVEIVARSATRANRFATPPPKVTRRGK